MQGQENKITSAISAIKTPIIPKSVISILEEQTPEEENGEEVTPILEQSIPLVYNQKIQKRNLH